MRDYPATTDHTETVEPVLRRVRGVLGDAGVFVHPRNPYTRVDALRSSKAVRVELSGVMLADSAATVTVFETGLPTR